MSDNPGFENIVSGSAMLYANIRDVQMASRTGTGEEELKSFVEILPLKSKQKVVDTLADLEIDRDVEINKAKAARTTTPYRYNPNHKEINRVGLPEELTAINRDYVHHALGFVVKVLEEDGYIYQEGRKVEQGGILEG